MLTKYRDSRRAQLITLGVMYLVMLVLNILTKKLADDFTYSFNFYDKMPIESFADLVQSITAHGQWINGRYFSHTLAQVFLLLPDIAFDLINSAVFVLTVYMTYRLAIGKKTTDNLLLVGIFGFIWLFEMDFGQINLWLDGSCNYLFAVLFGLLYITPFVNSCLHKKQLHPLLILPHLLLSVWFGGYLEMTSVGFVCAALLFTLAEVFIFKNYRALLLSPSVVGGFLGFLIIALSPAQSANKVSGFSILDMLTTFGVALLVLASVFPILIIFVRLLRRSLVEQPDHRAAITALALMIGALSSNFVMVFAKYYALRCSVAFVFMSIFATAVLFGSSERREFSPKVKRWAKVFTVALSLAIIVGVCDNAATFAVIEEHEEIIAEAIESGEGEVELYRPIPFSKYNSVWGLLYLNTEDSSAWPNADMAKYFRIGKIHGRSRLKELLEVNDIFGW